ncbi:kinase-like domain-containing protein [Rhizophagus irregularis DAOM 181602=DAOM 197198]|uniref:Kinase-like domain-containing protein n=1 Tax=Rhizophagus irregularis (strain DAOM 181602 / DAOM 197198 / MUCL 43194) TaxID=747089 RepID=A0A2P4PX74_RHIID|nr:kinase-like domain-containing protein [Rhizophagus irregularis DAOM 181602=DAOM 197198]POG69982.1 kinase-like domain-containing protein [Rhizophagus irregularis DAOM 181602=DAOM 197198]|eukprot:XP_025176848.1 kinase-like domain-containing protein [Rhizophagus irregularis DAOM 181602=DAOM 197198]
MTEIRKELVSNVMNKAYSLTDYNIQNTLDKQYEFKKKTVLADKSLTKNEKSYAIKRLNKDSDYYKLLYNEGTKRICENCHDECLATLYCEHCVRNYLKSNFSNWTSGNNDIDNLIQQCQMETINPDRIVEWIPYNNLQNINYLTRGGCSEIYTAVWTDGRYDEWDSKAKQLERFGRKRVILKKLENVERANRSWFEECKSHLSISSKCGQVVQCYGITKNPSDGNYMLVMQHMDINLREYLQQNHNKLIWKERIQIIHIITFALFSVHQENAIHRDLHSGNILFATISQIFEISDFGFCGPADKPLNSIYGNLPYIAPEVICGKQTTFASDIYSIGMLMWEISSGQSPFINFENDCELALKIINGMRPKIVLGTPLEYKELMEQCWDADPTKRPDIDTLDDKIGEMNRLNYQNELKKNKSIVKKLFEKIVLSKSKANTAPKINEISNFENNNTSSRLFTKEQEAFHSKTYNYNIPYNIDNFINKNNDNASKSINIIEDDNKELSEVTEIIQINYSNSNNVQNDYKKEIIQQVKKHNFDYIDDENEIYNNPNLHSEEQDELVIPDDGF